MRYKEIAHELGLTVGTVRQYTRRAIEKLDAKTRDHAVAIFVARRDVTPISGLAENRPPD